MSSGPVSREEFESLRLELARLRLEVAELRAAKSSAGSASEFEQVDLQSSRSFAPSPRPSPVALAGTDLSAERVSAAESIGAWLRRCLNDQPRGLSGRERIPQASRYYLVARGVDLVCYNPPRVFESWKDTKSLVHLRGQPGDSIFVGVPTKAEARIVCAVADLSTPSCLLHK